MSLPSCPNSSVSIASLYFGKYASISYTKTLYCKSISSAENIVLMFDNTDCP